MIMEKGLVRMDHRCLVLSARLTYHDVNMKRSAKAIRQFSSV
jgi:hypothetical protein